jgi:polyketide synthase PksN
LLQIQDSKEAFKNVEERTGALVLEPCWKDQDVPGKTEASAYTERIVFLCELEDVEPANIEPFIRNARFISLKSQQSDTDKRFETYVVSVLEEIKTILLRKNKGRVLIQVLFCSRDEHQLFMGLTGLLRTAWLENPGIMGQVISVNSGMNPAEIIEILEENSQRPQDAQIRYQNGKRQIMGWNKRTDWLKNEKHPWKDGGVYLITGGAVFGTDFCQRYC